MELNKYTKQCKYVIAVFQIKSPGFSDYSYFFFFYSSSINSVEEQCRYAASARTQKLAHHGTHRAAHLQQLHYHHIMYDCIFTMACRDLYNVLIGLLDLLIDFSTSVYLFLYVNAHQPLSLGLRDTPCERTIVLHHSLIAHSVCDLH